MCNNFYDKLLTVKLIVNKSQQFTNEFTNKEIDCYLNATMNQNFPKRSRFQTQQQANTIAYDK